MLKYWKRVKHKSQEKKFNNNKPTSCVLTKILTLIYQILKHMMIFKKKHLKNAQEED